MIDLAFTLYRTQAFVDYLVDKSGFIPDEDAIRDFTDIALERVRRDFPGIRLELDEIKDEEE